MRLVRVALCSEGALRRVLLRSGKRQRLTAMPRVIWKGAISFGLVNIPIGLYPAAKGSGLSFTMLDRRDMSPVGYKRINKSSGAEVPWDEIVKGYEYEDGE